jgi:G protein-coupled receptor GPR1
MFKALWFMVFPIVVFLHGPVDDNSDFCKISGFFLAIGMEASGSYIQELLDVVSK